MNNIYPYEYWVRSHIAAFLKAASELLASTRLLVVVSGLGCPLPVAGPAEALAQWKCSRQLIGCSLRPVPSCPSRRVVPKHEHLRDPRPSALGKSPRPLKTTQLSSNKYPFFTFSISDVLLIIASDSCIEAVVVSEVQNHSMKIPHIQVHNIFRQPYIIFCNFWEKFCGLIFE